MNKKYEKKNNEITMEITRKQQQKNQMETPKIKITKK